MIRRNLRIATIAVALGCALFGLFYLSGVIFSFRTSSELVEIEKNQGLPKGAFQRAAEEYTRIDGPFMSLEVSPAKMRLPDLRKTLIFLGTNQRPDLDREQPILYFALKGQFQPKSIYQEKRLYLFFDKKKQPPRYEFSPNNAETTLWISAQSSEDEVVVTVSMQDEKGEEIATPEEHHTFSLPRKEYSRYGMGAKWEIGGVRVDSTLLVKQKARWYGRDLFLEERGGDDFKQSRGKERIDFGSKGEIYSVFVAESDLLMWNGTHWQEVFPGQDSVGKPLIQLKAVEERAMRLELWDPEGKAKLALNLIRSKPEWAAGDQVSLRFVGARTRNHATIELGKQRIGVKTRDWLVLSEGAWKKLSTPEEIQDFASRRLTGVLFIFEGLVRKDERQVLKGVIYDATRTQAIPVEVGLEETVNPLASESRIAAPPREEGILRQPVDNSSPNEERESERIYQVDDPG